jgi:lipocalin
MKRFVLFLAMLMGVQAHADMTTVPYVDLGRYAGTWYQIARKILPFEQNCVCAQQILNGRADGTVGVYNSCNHKTVDGPLREISGFAVNQDPVTNAKFLVDFGFPKKGQYWVIGLDADYRYAVVSEPSRSSLYILSKTPELPADLYQQALEKARAQVDTSDLVLTEQRGCQYPTPPTTWIDPADIRNYQPRGLNEGNISETEFRTLIQKAQSTYAPIVNRVGGRLTISGDWKNQTPNAAATQFQGTWMVRVSGGLARHPEITADGLTLIICHELGHHLGGFSLSPQQHPFEKPWAASEGQSDYFATHVCARRLWGSEVSVNRSFEKSVKQQIRELCDPVWRDQADRNLCYRTLTATDSVIATMAALKGVPMPNYATPDQKAVTETSYAHPAPQCRMDTALQGALCTASFNEATIPGKNASGGISGIEAEREAARNSCTAFSGFSTGLRPTCWFKARL